MNTSMRTSTRISGAAWIWAVACIGFAMLTDCTAVLNPRRTSIPIFPMPKLTFFHLPVILNIVIVSRNGCAPRDLAGEPFPGSPAFFVFFENAQKHTKNARNVRFPKKKRHPSGAFSQGCDSILLLFGGIRHFVWDYSIFSFTLPPFLFANFQTD